MPDPNETPLLRSIAEDDDPGGRLVLADWLEERGDGPRAEFLRVQCELASRKVSKERRRALRVRERALLDAHRQEWLQAFGLPLEDVGFQGGLIARTRLAVDFAHLGIQMYHGILEKTVLRRLMDYERVAEVHVSTSHEHRDTHAKLAPTTWGVEWAREHLAKGTPVILECYMHKLSHEERLEQVAWMT
jgi:uncharacterized protein (TIGR02996 family)